MLEVQTEGLDFTLRRIEAKIDRLREGTVGTHFAERDLLEERIAELEERRDCLLAAFKAHRYAELFDQAAPARAIPLRHLRRFVRRGFRSNRTDVDNGLN